MFTLCCISCVLIICYYTVYYWFNQSLCTFALYDDKLWQVKYYFVVGLSIGWTRKKWTRLFTLKVNFLKCASISIILSLHEAVRMCACAWHHSPHLLTWPQYLAKRTLLRSLELLIEVIVAIFFWFTVYNRCSVLRRRVRRCTQILIIIPPRRGN